MLPPGQALGGLYIQPLRFARWPSLRIERHHPYLHVLACTVHIQLIAGADLRGGLRQVAVEAHFAPFNRLLGQRAGLEKTRGPQPSIQALGVRDRWRCLVHTRLCSNARLSEVSMKLELVGFKICPFVQRVNILIQHKAIPCTVTYLNPKEPPEWLAVLSPRGKVPLLKVDDTVLFESQVINEFLDETHPPALLPAAPLARARERGLVAVADDLFSALWQLITAKTEDELAKARGGLRHQLNILETLLHEGGGYFTGATFGLVDCAFAPFFMRLDLLEANGAEALAGEELPRVAAYRKALAEVSAVKCSVVPEFAQLYLAFVKGQGGALGDQLV